MEEKHIIIINIMLLQLPDWRHARAYEDVCVCLCR